VSYPLAKTAYVHTHEPEPERVDSGPLSQKSAGHMQNRKTITNTNPIVLTLTDTGGAVLTLMLG